MINQIITDQIEYFNTVIDPRTKDFFLISSPIPTLCLVAAYLISVKYILPTYMRDRPAFQLKSTLFYYNLIQVILSAYIVYLSFCSGYVRRFSLLKCRDLDLSPTDPDALMAVSAVYVYFLAKFIEFLDTEILALLESSESVTQQITNKPGRATLPTRGNEWRETLPSPNFVPGKQIFFILRKKDSQVTFLHLFHHASMPVNAWIMTKIMPGGSVLLVPGINSSVHVVMYTYYLLSAMGPRWQKYLWWKKYLTQVQLIQFSYGVSQVFFILATSSECVHLKKRSFMLYYAGFYLSYLFYLFGCFYQRAYIKQMKDKNQTAQKMK